MGASPGLEASVAALRQTVADVRVVVDATAAQEVAAHHARCFGNAPRSAAP